VHRRRNQRAPSKNVPPPSSGGSRRCYAKRTRGCGYGACVTTRPAGAARPAAATPINAARASPPHVIKAMHEGKAQEDAVETANFAALGYRHRFVIRWPNVPYWDDLEFYMCNDGTWKRTSTAPSRPEIDPQFFELAASPWLRDAVLRADTEA
jgi:hypothetical protein